VMATLVNFRRGGRRCCGDGAMEVCFVVAVGSRRSVCVARWMRGIVPVQTRFWLQVVVQVRGGYGCVKEEDVRWRVVATLRRRCCDMKVAGME